MSAAGTSAPERLTSARPGRRHNPYSWTKDGARLLFGDRSVDAAITEGDIMQVALDERRTIAPILAGPAVEVQPALSPDGRWLAYASNETLGFEVYVEAFPNLGRKQPISTDGGAEPIWSKDGRELFYRNGNKMMAVTIAEKGDTLEPGRPTLLFEARFAVSDVSGGDAWYDVSHDGTRFLMLKTDDAANGALTIVVVENWVNELKQLVPEK
jgi:Tol biopolymer transport system component